MAYNEAFYDLTCEIGHPVVDLAMAQALATADGATCRLLIEQLLERGHEPALVVMIGQFHRFKSELQQVVVDHALQLDSAIRLAAHEADIDTRMNMVELVMRAGAVRLAYLLAGQLQADDARLTRTAAAGLAALAEGLSDRQWVDAATSITRRYGWLNAALCEACSSYHRHGRHDVLAAVALLAPMYSPQLLAHLRDHRGAVHTAITRMIRSVDRPEIARAMLSFAAVPELAPAVVDGLKTRKAAEYLPALLSRSYLLVVPAVRSTFRKAHEPVQLLPNADIVHRLSADNLRQTPRWVHHLFARTELKVAALTAVVAHHDRVARLLALRVLIRMEKVQADDLIATMCHDPEPGIAGIALRHLMARQWSGLPDLLVKLISSPHPDVARLAESRFSPVGFTRFWEHWDKIEPAVRQSAGAALIKLDAHFHHQLAARMASSNSANRFKAVMIARELGQESFFERQLLDLMLDTDSKVASAAATAAGAISDSRKAVEHLTEALNHRDDRVRANAVESLEKMDALDQAYRELTTLCDSSGNRSRANAIKAMMQMPIGGALGALGRMLRDDSSEHRASALWVVEQLGLEQVASRVAELAQRDPDPQIRRKALTIFRQMAMLHAQRGAAASNPGA